MKSPGPRPLLTALCLLVLAAPALPQAPTVEEQLKLARVELRDYEYRRAEKVFRAILAGEPGNRDARLGLARALRGVGEHPAATAIYEALRKLDPEDYRPHLGLGLLVLYVDRKKEARNHCATALSLAPKSHQALSGMARVEVEDGNYKAAERLLVIAEKVAPEAEGVLSVRAEYCFRTLDMDGAARTLRRLLTVNPKSLEAHVRLANGFIESDRPYYTPKEVPREYAAAIEAAIRKYRALDLDGAEAAFRGLDGKDSPDARPTFFRGLIELRRGRLRVAIAHLWRALDRDPENFLVRNALAIAYRTKIQLQRAEYGGGEDGIDRLRPLAADLPAPGVEKLGRFVRGYRRLLPAERRVVLRAVAPLANYIPSLVEKGITHDILGFEEGMCDAKERHWILSRRTHDGRWYGALRGVGGKNAATGIEAILAAGAFDYDTFAHEFAHQVHRFALTRVERMEIKKLYRTAMGADLCLDYYAASNEWEYFAQGYEAFVCIVKSPYRHSLRRHTRAELRDRDPALYGLLLRLTDTKDPDPTLAAVAPKVLAFYDWAADDIEASRARGLLGPLLGPEGGPDRK